MLFKLLLNCYSNYQAVIQTVIQSVQGVLVQNIQIGLSVFSVQEQSECLRRLVVQSIQSVLGGWYV